MVQKIDIDIDGIEADDNTKELLQNGVPAYIKKLNMPNGTKETVKIDENFQENVISA